jgi:hypothetical protein
LGERHNAVDSVVALKKLTSTIPIVSGALADPINLGLIESEARPGGNVTGIEPYLPGLPAKQIELAAANGCERLWATLINDLVRGHACAVHPARMRAADQRRSDREALFI